jgi:hypothetical protein
MPIVAGCVVIGNTVMSGWSESGVAWNAKHKAVSVKREPRYMDIGLVSSRHE